RPAHARRPNRDRGRRARSRGGRGRSGRRAEGRTRGQNRFEKREDEVNLAWRDIRHKFGRFLLTCLGLSLLLAVEVTMAGIYRGQTADALALLRAVKADIWIVEADTLGPF